MKYFGEEDRLHATVNTYLRAQYPDVMAIHVPNEGKRSVWEAAKAKKLGLRAGIADWLIFAPVGSGRMGLALELKAAKGKLTEKQAEFLSIMETRHGWFTAVARNFDEAKHFIDEFLN